MLLCSLPPGFIPPGRVGFPTSMLLPVKPDPSSALEFPCFHARDTGMSSALSYGDKRPYLPSAGGSVGKQTSRPQTEQLTDSCPADHDPSEVTSSEHRSEVCSGAKVKRLHMQIIRVAWSGDRECGQEDRRQNRKWQK